jgi:heme-degrading monooxygenase HmoA
MPSGATGPASESGPAIIEYVRYDLPADQRSAFEAAYARVGGILSASPHCLGWELRRSVEEPRHYVVRIEWDSLAGHVRGFRESAPFPAFFGELSVFADFRQEMAHYELVRNQLSTAEGR